MLMSLTREILLTAAESKAADQYGHDLAYYVERAFDHSVGRYSEDLLSLSVKKELAQLGFVA